MSLWCVNLSLVKGCTRKCGFCGIHSLPMDIKNSYNYMNLDIVKKIINDLKGFKTKIRIEFSLFGEPLLHPNIYEIISLFRKGSKNFQLNIVTNGDKIQDGSVDINELFKNGTDYLMIDYYNRKDEDRRNLDEKIFNSKVKVFDYLKDKKSIWSYNKKDSGSIIIVDDLNNTQNTLTRKYHTVGGNMLKKVWGHYGINEKDFPVLKRCGKIFTEIVIDYDGIVPFCCVDWNRENVLGDIKIESLKDIFYKELVEKYRFIIYNKRRDLIQVCSMCNNTTQRTGLLTIRKEYLNLIEKLELKLK